jgi:regulation of enolase protein 1 (concanavalin A-like superfamily)
MMATTPGNGAWFGRRAYAGETSVSTRDPAGTPPAWVRLVRKGDLFEAYRSVDGANWIRVGSDTIPMGATLYVGLAVTSHNAATRTRSTFENVRVTRTGGSGNQNPVVTLTSPASGSQFTVGTPISLSASASDPENRMDSVDFYVESTMIARDASAPYEASWTPSAPSTYALRAWAKDRDGGDSWSSWVPITVVSATQPGGGSEPPSGSSGLPSGQIAADVGSPAVSGQTTYSNGTYTVRAGGRDIWDAADQFHFVYLPVSGDTEVVARVARIDQTDPWAKAGVMIRENTTAGSRHATMAATSANGAWFGRRTQANGMSVSTKDSGGALPTWLRLVRRGTLFEAYRSVNGTSWTQIGSETISMAATVYVGLAATSHNTTAATTVTFDNVRISTPAAPAAPAGNLPPTVTLTQPASGAQYSAGASISLAASASDPEGQLAQVEFLNGQTVLGTDTTAPYTFTWSNVAAGTYSLTAKARDTAGAVATSTPVTVTVAATTSSAPRLVVFTASADHATNVTSYFFEVFAAGANPSTAAAIASSDLGKPTPGANNEISVDRSALFSGLAPANYIATVTAIGPGGRTRGAPVTFTR